MTDKLAELTLIVTSLKTDAKELIKEMLLIMEDISQKKSEIVSEVVHRTKGDKTAIINWLEQKTVSIVEDSEKVIKEIDIFAENIIKGPKELEAESQKYPFLSEVWFGDMYNGKEGKNALKALHKEISKHLKEDANADAIIEAAVAQFSES
jgi:hypothetical protein